MRRPRETDTPHRSLTYAEAGVPVELEGQASRILYEAAKRTWVNRQGKIGEVTIPRDRFSGMRYVRMGGLPSGTIMTEGEDGVGTKPEVARRANNLSTLGIDLVAMVADDAVITGAEPALLTNTLVISTLHGDEDRLPYIIQLAAGLEEGARQAGVAVLNGELAQHGNMLSEEFSVDWSAQLTAFGHETRQITGERVIPGDYLIGLAEPGFRCNGLSLVRAAFKELFGESWDKKQKGGQSLAELALLPSTIYAPAVVEMTGGWSIKQAPKANLHGAAHITGGGIPEKLGRALKASGLGAEISEPFAPSELMLLCQKAGVADEEAYRTWNMGQGMILISPSYSQVLAIAEAHGFTAQVIGQVTKKPGIIINSRGLNGGVLEF